MKGARYGIAVEGWPLVLALLVLALGLLLSPWPYSSALPALAVLLAVLKFRDPPRTVTADPLGVLSPVDGIARSMEQHSDGYCIRLDVGLLGAYLLRSPTEGKVLESGSERGGHGLRIRTDEGEEVLLRLNGPHWLPAAAAIGYGQRVGQGQRCGVVRAARHAEIWLPRDATILVTPGQAVRAGETVLGRFAVNGVKNHAAAGSAAA